MQADSEIRILIADDHAMFRDALRNLLEAERGLCVVGEARDGREVLDRVGELKPDVLLLDLALPQMSGIEVLRELSELPVDIRTIVLTAAIERGQLVDALKLGARGVILKEMATQLLFKGIRAVMAGQYWVGHDGVVDLVNSLRAAAALPRDSRNGSDSRLSKRELEIVDAIVDGCTNKDIAKKFSLSEQTVKHHLTKIYHKVGVTNRLELALYAMNHQLSSD